jgi:peptidoglycan-binding protein ArfA
MIKPLCLAAAAVLLLAGCTGTKEGTEASTKSETSTTSSSAAPSTSTAPVATAPPTSSLTSVIPGVPAPVLEPFLLTVNGTNVTVSGDVADQAARTAIMDAIAAALGPDAKIADTMTVNPGTIPFDTVQITNLLNAAKPITNFGLRRDPDKVTLTGAAPAEADKGFVESAAKALFPEPALVNEITVGPAPTPTR